MFGLFKKKKSHYHPLREKWEKKHVELQEGFWERHKESLGDFFDKTKQWGVSSLAGFVLLASGGNATAMPAEAQSVQEQKLELNKNIFLVSDLQKVLPQTIDPLTPEQENSAMNILSREFHLNLFAEKDGIRLNRNYGYIGQEQHLPRYPGDTIEDQLPSQQDYTQYESYGMTPGLGAWGYFSYSRNTLTEKDIQREKYYIAVPTFMSPGYNEHVQKFNTFFKYRKMLVVNPENGKAIVADIADSGPSPWTGKHLGGSPEVMHYLERYDGAQKGPVLYFFIDDPNNSVPLGPIDMTS